MIFNWVNQRTVIKFHWGYKSKGMTKEAYQRLLDETVYPAYERLKKEFIEKDLFDPTIIYGYYPCRSDDKDLYIFGEEEGWNVDANASRVPFDEVKEKAVGKFDFPRQGRKPHRALSDFFHHDRHDIPTYLCECRV